MARVQPDGSMEPEEQGYAGPFEYRDCPVFNVLQGIWSPESLIGAVESWDVDVLSDVDLMGDDCDLRVTIQTHHTNSDT